MPEAIPAPVLTKMQIRYRDFPEKVKSMNKRWYLKNREKALADSRVQYQKNRELRKQQTTEWSKKHPDITKASYKKWKAKNPNYQKTWEGKNRQRINAQKRAKYNENLELSRAKRKAWRAKNPVLYRSFTRKYEALKRAARVNLKGIKGWSERLKAKSSVPCYYCGKRVATDEMHIDHIVALSKGGAHSADNLCVACPSCNHSKSDKPIRAWIRMGQQILEL